VRGDEIEQLGGGDGCTPAEARVEEPGHDAVDGEVSPVLTTQPTGVDGDRAATCDIAETEADGENRKWNVRVSKREEFCMLGMPGRKTD